jgi:hypothetical protein
MSVVTKDGVLIKKKPGKFWEQDPFFDAFIEYVRPLLEYVVAVETQPPEWIVVQRAQCRTPSRKPQHFSFISSCSASLSSGGNNGVVSNRLLHSMHLAPSLGYHWRPMSAFFNSRQVQSAHQDRWKMANPTFCIRESNYERLMNALLRAFGGFSCVKDARYVNITILPIACILFIRHERSCSLLEAERAYYGDDDLQHYTNKLLHQEEYEPDLNDEGLLNRPKNAASLHEMIGKEKAHLLGNLTGIREYCKQRARQEIEYSRAQKKLKHHHDHHFPTEMIEKDSAIKEMAEEESSSIATATTVDASESTAAMGALASALVTNLIHL